MSDGTVEALRADVLAIERTLDDGSYRPGPWAAMLRRAENLSRDQRLALEADVSRVSDKLHRRNHPGRTLRVRTGILLELFVSADALLGLYLGLRWEIGLIVVIAAFVLSYTAQPLVKMLAGTLLGVRYSYFYREAVVEPRVKMRYGTYLALSNTRRVILHCAGMVGSPAALLLIGSLISAPMSTAASVCLGIGWGFVGLNLMLFLLGFAGVGKIDRVSSGGAAAREIRNSLRSRTA